MEKTFRLEYFIAQKGETNYKCFHWNNGESEPNTFGWFTLIEKCDFDLSKFIATGFDVFGHPKSQLKAEKLASQLNELYKLEVLK